MPAEVRPSSAGAILWLTALLVASLAGWRALDVGRAQLAAPFDIQYETPNLRTVELLRAGRNPYSPEVYAAAPFWLTLYTPLYHATVATLPADPGNPYFSGRWVGLVCALLATAGIAWAGRRSPALALTLAAAFWLVRPVTQNAALLKNDTLALALSIAAVLAASRAPRSWGWTAAAASAAVLALCAKQSFAAAPAACAAYLALHQGRAGARFLALFAALAGGLLALARWAYGPGFFFSTVTALRNPLTWRQFGQQWEPMLRQPVFLTLLALFAAGLAAALWRERLAVLRRSPLALYALISLGVLLATLGKVGSNTNYFLEPTAALCAWLAWSAHGSFERARRGLLAAAAAVTLSAAALLEAGLAARPEYALAGHPAKERFRADLESAAAAIRSLHPAEPRILNLVYAGLAHPLPGEILVSDPFLYFLLWNTGVLSSEPVAELLRARAVDGVLVPPGLRPPPPGVPQASLFRALFAGYRPAASCTAFEYWVRTP